jgi:hypothetical protein
MDCTQVNGRGSRHLTFVTDIVVVYLHVVEGFMQILNEVLVQRLMLLVSPHRHLHTLRKDSGDAPQKDTSFCVGERNALQQRAYA